MISVANGVHSQATIMMTESIGACANQSIGAKPSDFAIQAKKPETGFIRRFFHTSAETVGMMKKGAITIRRTMPWPKIGLSRSSASSVPSTTVMMSTDPTSTSVLMIAVVKAALVTKYV